MLEGGLGASDDEEPGAGETALVEDVTPGALARADAAFRSDRAPWCPEIF